VVENCFKHGFVNMVEKMVVTVAAKRENGRMTVTVTDNGRGLDAVSREKLDRRIGGRETGGGTAMIAQKLRSLYGDRFTFSAQNGRDCGVQVEISWPL